MPQPDQINIVELLALLAIGFGILLLGGLALELYDRRERRRMGPPPGAGTATDVGDWNFPDAADYEIRGPIRIGSHLHDRAQDSELEATRR
jgi:hypothetical protein